MNIMKKSIIKSVHVEYVYTLLNQKTKTGRGNKVPKLKTPSPKQQQQPRKTRRKSLTRKREDKKNDKV